MPDAQNGGFAFFQTSRGVVHWAAINMPDAKLMLS
jgi:hypothetical protein